MFDTLEIPAVEENRYAMLCYLATRGQLLEQIEIYNSLWDELLEQPMQADWLRLLRINLRKLRSAIKLLEPLLPNEGKEWLLFLKSTSEGLGKIREYDVALKECDKFAANQLERAIPNSDICQELYNLKAALNEKRQAQTEFWLLTAEAGCIANGLKNLLELIKNTEELSVKEEALANAFLQARLQSWGMKLCNKLQNGTETDSLDKLHALRIKVKRFRYAYDVYMNTEADCELVEGLKNAQDLLGSVHDGCCDISIMEKLVVAANDEQLTREFVCFKEWRLEKNRQRLDNLPKIRAKLIYALQCNVAGAKLL